MSAELVFGSGPICRGYSQVEMYTFAVVPQTYTSNLAGTVGTNRDMATLIVSGAVTYDTFSVQFADDALDGSTLINLTDGTHSGYPHIADFSGSAVATFVANGLAQIEVQNALYGNCLLTAPVSANPSQSFVQYTDFSVGTLSHDLLHMIQDYIVNNGLTGTINNTAPFNLNNGVVTNTRNPSLWCKYLVDLTAITRDQYGSNLVGGGGTFTHMALIGPHHILTAAHVMPGVGAMMVWCDNAGVAYGGVVAANAAITGTDIGVCYIRDATSSERAIYSAQYPNSPAVTQPLSAAAPAFSSSAAIKPMALFPANTWGGVGVSCPMPLATNAKLINQAYLPMFHSFQPGRIGLYVLSQYPTTVQVNNSNGTSTFFANEFGINQPSTSPQSTFANAGVLGNTASGDQSFTAIPANSTLATNNPTLGAGYPILIGASHDGVVPVLFNMPWLPLYLTQITAAMQSTAQAAGDSAYATYAPHTVSLTGYANY
jgi:hypothetical protein